MNRITFLATLLILSCILVAQDTLTVLQYNLLNYGNYTSYCTSENNNISLKDQYIRTIIEYIEPDIFTVNEISKTLAMQQRMLDNNLNINGINYFKKANFINVANSYIVNSLYYNSEKLILHSHTIAQSYIRDIDVYKLYYRSDDLPDGDTAFIICVVAHLKSSSGSQNVEKRRVMANNAMNYLESYNNDANYLFMGDFNVYSSNEPAYQLLINNPNTELGFNDPVNTPGDWHNKYTYRHVHTQSTHSTQNGCASYGGMDDRFDFILMSDNIIGGTKYIQYIEDSYSTIGQDGLHFNKSIIDEPTNASAPSGVIDALFGNSDHLPVSVKLRVNKVLSIPENKPSLFGNISFNNPASGSLNVTVSSSINTTLKFEMFSIAGRPVITEEKKIAAGVNNIYRNIDQITPGIYFAVFTDCNNIRVIKKVVVN